MFAKFLKLTSKKHQETQEIDQQLKQTMKDIEDKIAEPITKIVKTSQNAVRAAATADKDAMNVAAGLSALASKDLSRDNQESAYVLALAKFADILRDSASLDTAYGQETTDKLITPLSNFHRVEVTENVRIHRKAYEKATQDFSGALSKTDQLHSSKKQDILKLYAAEKERVRLKKIYEACVYDLRQQTDEVQERINIDVLEQIVDSIDAQKRYFGLLYSELDEIKSYMDDLQAWCNEERGIFAQHQQERAAARAAVSIEEALLEMKQLLDEFDTETVGLIKQVGAQNPMLYQDIDGPLSDLARKFQGAAPESLTMADFNHPSLQTLMNVVKALIVPIGNELLLRQKQDKLVSLTEALGQMEKAPAASAQ
eukprot:TRINITY_DN2102_c0_g1_i1.p1 TRINITY_DN2102_c0_g1~~TRINITY_DN2102_c0_g1_i1.p1  ORF type:complete len:370 (-),score=98.18 TRINITY_DN2102_c0_g1_i1:50-1159(-)